MIKKEGIREDNKDRAKIGIERRKGEAKESSVLSCKCNCGLETLTFAPPSGKSVNP
jgi:hypothetical protein